MKKLVCLFLLLPIFFACSESDQNNKNPYIPSYNVNFTVDMNLPSYSKLKFISNGVIVPQYGAKGIIIFNAGSNYNAYDAACPNQDIKSCSAMTIFGINAKCSCDDSEYSLYNGLGNKKYPLKQYKVAVNGSVIQVYN